MTDYTDFNATKERFKQIAKSKPNLAAALSDPLIDVFAAFAADVSVEAHFRMDRSDQERYLMSAANRSSVLGRSEDRQYTPRKAIPSSGTLTVTDDPNKPYGGLPSGIALVSNNAISYLTSSSVVFSGGAGVVDVIQAEKEVITHTVTEEKAFYEVLIPSQFSSRIADISVSVDMGAGFEPFSISRRLRNASDSGERSKVYDEFYTGADEFGVRFGTGVVGVKLPVGSVVQVTLLLTNGETTLIPNEKLKSADGSYQGVKFEVLETIDGGAAQEDIESIRRNSLYYEIHDDEYVWAEDYEYFLYRRFPHVTWASFWGERDQEIIAGAPSRDFINRIYVSAYDPTNPNIKADIEEALKDIPQLNKFFNVVEPVVSTFTVSISGTVQRGWTLTDARESIKSMLFDRYGKDSKNRKKKPLKRDIYEYLRGLKIFNTDFDVEVSIAGQTVPSNKQNFIYIDESQYVGDALITLDYGF